MLRDGDQIGDWIVDSCLGEGGMGAVYAAHNVLSDRIRAAVKVLKPHNLGEARERFVREVELLASIQHPAVVRVMGGGEDRVRGLLWFAMELIDGETLHERMARGPLSWDEACRVFTLLGSGLLHAHRMGVTHRDIKPGNIMLLADGGAKLLDFGIAVKDGGTRFTREGLVPGTMAYLPPEVFGGGKPDHTADIYALGQVLWETLTGKEAYPEDPDSSAGESMARLMGQKLQAEPLDPGDQVPDALRELVRRATNPEPEERLHDLAPFIETLRTTGGHALAELPPPPPPRRLEPKPAKLAPPRLAPPRLAPRRQASEAPPKHVPASSPSTFGLEEEAAETPAPSASRKSEGAELRPRRSRAPMLLAAAMGVVFIGCLGCGALLALAPSSDNAGGLAGQSAGYAGYGYPTQEVPAGFPFTVHDDAKIIMGVRNETDGQVAYNVTYTSPRDPAQLIKLYDREFTARGMTVSRSTSETAQGTSYTVSGYVLGGEVASASAGPQPMGMMVTVSWVPGP